MTSFSSAISGLSWPGRVGFAMAALLAVYMAVNTARALLQPEAFAAYLGAPLHDPRDIGFVLVYAFRAAFFALFVGALVLRGDIGALRLLALIGLVMPLGDAWLTWRHGGGEAFAIRHLIVAGVLLLTWFLLGLRARSA
jgi:hypothetical protein